MTAPTAPVTLPAPRRDHGAYLICCVCWGNICRSPMAEALLRSRLEAAGLGDRVVVDSAGTSDEEAGRPEHPSTRRLLARHGLALDHHQAREFRPSWISRYDLLVAMDHVHARILRRYAERAGVDLSRIRVVTDGGVADPWGRPDQAYEVVFDELDNAFDVLVPALTELLGTPRGPTERRTTGLQVRLE